MFGYTAWILVYLLAMDSEVPVVELIGRGACIAAQYISTAGVINGYIFGASIALIRKDSFLNTVCNSIWDKIKFGIVKSFQKEKRKVFSQ